MGLLNIHYGIETMGSIIPSSRIKPTDKLEVYRGGKWVEVSEKEFFYDFGQRMVNKVVYRGLSLPRPEKPFVEESKRKLIFGYTVIKVLHYLGAKGYTVKEAQKALQRLGLLVDKAKVAKQLKKGSESSDKPIKLLQHEREKLRKLAGRKILKS